MKRLRWVPNRPAVLAQTGPRKSELARIPVRPANFLQLPRRASYRSEIVGTANIATVLVVDVGGAMNLIIWLVVGGLIGWVASLIMKTDAQQGLVLNVVVGIIGALLGGWLLSPLIGAGTVNQGDFSLMGLLVSLGGAIILLFVVNLIRRGAAPRA
jgi:uncharacterized membrane protein YeaQ/YmgE (transglycosylase-associated protein family)